jgi:hypothetical protein
VIRTSRRTRLVLLTGAAAASLVAIVLVTLSVPLWDVPSGELWIGGHLYSYERESLSGEGNGWLNFTYRGVTFGFHMWCGPPSPGGATLCGNATGADGVPHPYSFSDGPPTVGPAPWQTWIGPDAHEAVQYQQGGMVRLLVAA